ncbi:MAG: LuxR family transcriptional regulator [Ardenticatenia bacterium]|nr:LuxR family transcriptional regulator [Ardenticatenia bacterium]
MIRVFLADDHRLFRQGVASLLEDAPDIEVVGEADDGLMAVHCVCELVPDVVLMDVHMPGINGTEATRVILRKCPRVRVLMLTVSEQDEDLFEAVRAGAHGYLLKNVDADELVAAIRQVHRGEAVLSPSMTARLMSGFREAERRPPANDVLPLTERELDILHLLAQGATNREIARALVLSEHTVKTHVHHILEKLGAENRAQAVAQAVHLGLISSSTNTSHRAELTERELEILRLLAQGATNREIARVLAISEHTVKTHVHHILEKLGAENRAQATAYALQQRLIPPE